jgi:hypothetical protein
MPRDWRWNPRLDLDLGQRCLFVTFVSLTFSWITSFVLPTFFSTLIDVVTIGVLIGAIAKSSIQLIPDGRAVLVTGTSQQALTKHLT